MILAVLSGVALAQAASPQGSDWWTPSAELRASLQADATKDTLELYRQDIARCEEQHPDGLECLNLRASAQRVAVQLQEWEAVIAHGQSMIGTFRRLKVFPGLASLYAIHAQMAYAYAATEQYDQAVKFYTAALAILRREGTNRDDQIPIVRKRLREVVKKQTAMNREAELLARVAEAEAADPPAPSRVVEIRLSLAEALEEQSRYTDAAEALQGAIDHLVEIESTDAQLIATLHIQIGWILRRGGRYAQAEAAIATGVAQMEKNRLDQGTPYYAALASLADVQELRRNFAEAEDTYRRAYQLAFDDPEVLTREIVSYVLGLSGLLRRRSAYDEDERMWRAVIAREEQREEPDNDSLLAIYDRFARILELGGQTARATPIRQNQLALARTHYGPTSSAILDAMLALASNYSKRKMTIERNSLAKSIVTLLSETEFHPLSKARKTIDIGDRLYNYGLGLITIPMLREAIVILPDNDKDVAAKAWILIAKLELDAERRDPALQAYDAAMEILSDQELLTPRIVLRSNFSHQLAELGRIEEGLRATRVMSAYLRRARVAGGTGSELETHVGPDMLGKYLARWTDRHTEARTLLKIATARFRAAKEAKPPTTMADDYESRQMRSSYRALIKTNWQLAEAAD